MGIGLMTPYFFSANSGVVDDTRRVSDWIETHRQAGDQTLFMISVCTLFLSVRGYQLYQFMMATKVSTERLSFKKMKLGPKL